MSASTAAFVDSPPLKNASSATWAASDQRYAPWQPAEVFWRGERKRVASSLLQKAGVFPQAGRPCLEIGCGRVGWLTDLLSWGVREGDLHGIDLDAARIAQARELLPVADLREASACELPWSDGTFQLVVISTLFTSILDPAARVQAAKEATRVLAPGGAILWYDFAYNSPRNPRVRKVTSSELKQLFPSLRGQIRSISLAPPLARAIVPRSWLLASLLEAIPPLRTHLLAVLLKPYHS